MNTESHFYLEHLSINAEQLCLADLEADEVATIWEYVVITKHLQRMDHLFRIFLFQKENMLYHYALQSSDKLKPKSSLALESNDYLAINALVISFISSGKTLIESIECFLKEDVSELYQEFKDNHLSKVFDTNFPYRFLLRLRNFAQHGHLPVSTNTFDDNKYCFNLERILWAPHFKHKATMEGEMSALAEEIYEKHSDYPHITLTTSLAEFSVAIMQIYIAFLKNIREVLHDSTDKIESLLSKRPDIIHKSFDELNGYVFYDQVDDTMHMFHSQDKPKKVLAENKNFASEKLRHEESELQKMRASFCFIELKKQSPSPLAPE